MNLNSIFIDRHAPLWWQGLYQRFLIRAQGSCGGGLIRNTLPRKILDCSKRSRNALFERHIGHQCHVTTAPGTRPYVKDWMMLVDRSTSVVCACCLAPEIVVRHVIMSTGSRFYLSLLKVPLQRDWFSASRVVQTLNLSRVYGDGRPCLDTIIN